MRSHLRRERLMWMRRRKGMQKQLLVVVASGQVVTGRMWVVAVI
jgi:hypothetical protein